MLRKVSDCITHPSKFLPGLWEVFELELPIEGGLVFLEWAWLNTSTMLSHQLAAVPEKPGFPLHECGGKNPEGQKGGPPVTYAPHTRSLESDIFMAAAPSGLGVASGMWAD